MYVHCTYSARWVHVYTAFFSSWYNVLSVGQVASGSVNRTAFVDSKLTSCVTVPPSPAPPTDFLLELPLRTPPTAAEFIVNITMKNIPCVGSHLHVSFPSDTSSAFTGLYEKCNFNKEFPIDVSQVTCQYTCQAKSRPSIYQVFIMAGQQAKDWQLCEIQAKWCVYYPFAQTRIFQVLFH